MARDSLLTDVTPEKPWWKKTPIWIIVVVVLLVVGIYPFLGDDAKPDASAKPSPQVSVGAVASTQQDRDTIAELRSLVEKYHADRTNAEAVQAGMLAKMKEFDERLQAIEKCACKKPCGSKGGKGKRDKGTKPVVPPPPSASVPAPVVVKKPFVIPLVSPPKVVGCCNQ